MPSTGRFKTIVYPSSINSFTPPSKQNPLISTPLSQGLVLLPHSGLGQEFCGDCGWWLSNLAKYQVYSNPRKEKAQITTTTPPITPPKKTHC